MRIEAYDFGTIKVDGETYTGDLKIISNTVFPGWWRLEGHLLKAADIPDVFEAAPEVLVVGTGYSGLMSISAEVKSRLDELGIELIAKPTGQAYHEFNRLVNKRRVAFVAHLTC
jgi:hypothetical protein